MDIYLQVLISNRTKRRQIRRHRQNLLELRLISSPFDLPERRFIQLFRFDKTNARLLIQRLEPFSRSTSITHEIQVLTTLHFFGCGSYQTSVGSNSILGLSQPSTSRAIGYITGLINDYLLDEAIIFPRGSLETAELKRNFLCKYNMPNIVGIIDGTLIPIFPPKANDDVSPGHLYVGRKGYHCLNVLVVIDANQKVLFADARFPGSVHDSAIWMVSPLRRLFMRGYTTVERQNTQIIGDSGLPLEPWLLTAIRDPPPLSPEAAFNKRLVRTRSSIERTFGIIKGRFKCVSKHRVLHYTPEKAAKIIYAVFTLHNMFTMGEEYFVDDIEIEDSDGEAEGGNAANTRNEWHTAGARVRERYVLNMMSR